MKDHLVRADLIEIIHKIVQVFLHSCNTKMIEDVDSGSLLEFGSMQKRMERGECPTTIPVWVERPFPKKEGQINSEGNKNSKCKGIGGIDPV